MSQHPESKSPSIAQLDGPIHPEEPPFSEHEVSDARSYPPTLSGGLKLATIAPGSMVSIPDTHLGELEPPRAKPDPYLGCTIDGRYKVESTLGEGGMGVVYRCRHTIIDKKVAMKVLRADLARDPEVTERFLTEARAASSIGNPHIIDISDFGQLPDGSTYFVMEYLEGTSLASAIEENKSLSISRIVHISRQLAEGLAAAHDRDIIHRDLKPDNIFLIDRGKEKDFVKILDFGIAKVSTAEHGITRAGTVFGTPHYMSPEQAAGAPIDHRVDIYALGVILYEMASGRVPFDADNFMGILTQHMYKAPVPIRALIPQPSELPPGLEAIILKCLSKRPEQRYQNMNELIEDLNRLDEGNIPTAVPEMMQRSGGFNVPADYFKKASMPTPVPASPERRPGSRWPLYAGIAGVATALTIVISIFAFSQSSGATTPDAQALPSATPIAIASEQPAEPAEQPKSKSNSYVLLAVVPTDAIILQGEKALGKSPLRIEVEEGKPVKLEILANGYESRTITLNGSEESLSIELVAEKPAQAQTKTNQVTTKGAQTKANQTAKPPATQKTNTKSPPPIGGGEIVNPWN